MAKNNAFGQAGIWLHPQRQLSDVQKEKHKGKCAEDPPRLEAELNDVRAFVTD